MKWRHNSKSVISQKKGTGIETVACALDNNSVESRCQSLGVESHLSNDYQPQYFRNSLYARHEYCAIDHRCEEDLHHSWSLWRKHNLVILKSDKNSKRTVKILGRASQNISTVLKPERWILEKLSKKTLQEMLKRQRWGASITKTE